MRNKFILVIFISILGFFPVFANMNIDIETGIIQSGYNDVRIPGDTGTLFSLSEDLTANNPLFYRLRLNYLLKNEDIVSILYAPLTIESSGQFNKNVLFEGETYPAGADIEGLYKFNSYRITYGFNMSKEEDSSRLWLGITLKVRDAKIALSSGSLNSSNSNIGVVPLIYFKYFSELTDKLGFLLLGDALVAPQGRAEDILLALTYKPSDQVQFKLGYRILEGGSDIKEVYTFSMIHYLVFGVTFDF